MKKYSRPTSKVNCLQCGKEFDKENRLIKQSEVHRNGKHFCSISCSSTHDKELRFGKDCKSNHMVRTAKKRATSKNMNFDLTTDFILEMFLKQDSKCHITGIKIFLPLRDEEKSLLQASIDRIDNSKGYTEDNVQLVSLGFNYMRNSLPLEDAIVFLKKLRE